MLNRFQLSKLNNWINDDGEVFIVYTRQSLADEIQLSYRRVIDSVKELKAMDLIWEHRCGRGDANQIYLARAVLTGCCDDGYDSAPFTAQEDSRPADTAYLIPEDTAASEWAETHSDSECPEPVETTYQELPDQHIKNCDTGTPRPAATACQEVQEPHVRNCGNSTSRSAGTASQELRKPHASYIDKNNTEQSDIDRKVLSALTSARHAHTHARASPDGQVDDEINELDEILDNCDLWAFEPATAKVFESAIERLFFSESFRIGNCVLPQSKVRSHLHELDMIRLQTAEHKISRNTDSAIRNTTAYTMAVIFNSIWETESDIMHDPYLNSLRVSPMPDTTERRDC